MSDAGRQRGGDWEALPGWGPVYAGLGRFRAGLTWRLMLVVVAPPALALTGTYGPPALTSAVLLAMPGLALVTSLMMVGGLVAYAHPPRASDLGPGARFARNLFGVLVIFDVGWLALAGLEVGTSSGAGLWGWVSGARRVAELVGLVSLWALLVSLRQLARFVAASPASLRVRHLRWGLPLVLGLAVLALAARWAVPVATPGWLLGLEVVLLFGAVLFIAGVISVVTDLRDTLVLTTSEFAAVPEVGASNVPVGG